MRYGAVLGGFCAAILSGNAPFAVAGAAAASPPSSVKVEQSKGSKITPVAASSSTKASKAAGKGTATPAPAPAPAAAAIRLPFRGSAGGVNADEVPKPTLLQLLYQQDRNVDFFHFDQSYAPAGSAANGASSDLAQEKAPRMGMLLSDQRCTLTPAPASASSATYYLIHCPAEVRTFDAQFLTNARFPEGPNFYDVFRPSGFKGLTGPLSKVTFNFDKPGAKNGGSKAQTTLTEMVQACYKNEPCFTVQIDAESGLIKQPAVARVIARHLTSNLPPASSGVFKLDKNTKPENNSVNGPVVLGLTVFENEPLVVDYQTFGLDYTDNDDAMHLLNLERHRPSNFYNETSALIFRPRFQSDLPATLAVSASSFNASSDEKQKAFKGSSGNLSSNAQAVKNFVLTDRSHAVTRNVTLHMKLLPSTSAELYDLRPSIGRLDPQFRPGRHAYLLRLDRKNLGKRLFIKASGMDDKNVQCSFRTVGDDQSIAQTNASGKDGVVEVSGSAMGGLPLSQNIVRGKGVSDGIKITESDNQGPIITVTCRNVNDPENRVVAYFLETVFEAGRAAKTASGDSQYAPLKFLSVLTGDEDDDTPLPLVPKQEVYTVNADRGWVAFYAKPQAVDPTATITVENVPLDRTTHMSPFFKVNKNDKKLFRVRVSRKDSRVQEEIKVLVTRPSSYNSHDFAIRFGQNLGVASTVASATRAYHFLVNWRLLQWLGVTSSLPSAPSAYKRFSSFFDLNSYISSNRCRKWVRYVDDHSSSGADAQDGDLSSRIVSPPALYSVEDASGKLALNNWQAAPISSEDLEVMTAALNTHQNQELDLQHLSSSIFEGRRFPANFMDCMSADRDACESMNEEGLNKLKQPVAESESLADSTNTAANTTSHSNDDYKANDKKEGLGKSTGGRKGRLLTVMATERTMNALDRQYRESWNLLRFFQAWMVTTLALALTAVAYGLIYMRFLRRSRSRTLNRTFMRCLHPVRFWLFVCDIAFVSYAQAGMSLLFSSEAGRQLVLFDRWQITARAAAPLFVLTAVLIPIAFLIAGSMLLQAAASSMVFSQLLSRYQDKQVVELKAVWRPLPWLPVLGRLFDVEIGSIAPVMRAPENGLVTNVLLSPTKKEGPENWLEFDCREAFKAAGDESQRLTLMKETRQSERKADIADAATDAGDADADADVDAEDSTTRMLAASGDDTALVSQKLQFLKETPDLKYYARADKVRVQLDYEFSPEQITHIHAAQFSAQGTQNSPTGADAGGVRRNHYLSNARAAMSYPDAFVAWTKECVVNSYNEKIQIECELVLKNLCTLMNCCDADKFTVTTPRENLMFVTNDRLSNLMAHCYRDNLFYWTLERICILAVVAVNAFASSYGANPSSKTSATSTTSATNSSHGKLQPASIMLLLTSGALVCCAVMGAVGTSASRFWRQMDADARAMVKASAYQLEDEKKFLVWPFRDPKARQYFAAKMKRTEDLKNTNTFWLVHNHVSSLHERIVTDTLWKTRFGKFLMLFFTSYAFTEVMKLLIALFIVCSAKSLNVISDGVASSFAIYCACVAIFCLNYEAMLLLFEQLKVCLKETYYQTRRVFTFTKDLVDSPDQLLARIDFYLHQLNKALIRRQKGTSFIFPGFQSEVVRHFQCSDVYVHNSETGVLMRGRVKERNATKRAVGDENNALAVLRHGFQKTLFLAGTVGVFRSEIDRALPIQVPFMPFAQSRDAEDDYAYTHGKKQGSKQLGMLVGTVQIVNHASLRYIPRQAHESVDDSFLSLYTDPKLVPARGDIKHSKIGHGYAVHVDNVFRRLTIRGPGILAGKMYTVSLSAHKPPRDQYHLDDLDSQSTDRESVSGRATSQTPLETASALVHCNQPGVLLVDVPEKLTPDLQQVILLVPPSANAGGYFRDPGLFANANSNVNTTASPNGSGVAGGVATGVSATNESYVPTEMSGGQTIEVDPAAVYVHWDRQNRVMTIRTRGALITTDHPYKVIWRVESASSRCVFRTESATKCRGLLLFSIEPDCKLSLSSYLANTPRYLTIRDSEKKVTIDINAGDTNAHEFPLSAVCDYNIPGGALARKWARANSELHTWFKRESIFDYWGLENIACTVVQCIDPVGRRYRVEPDFYLALRRLGARLEEIYAMKAQLERMEYLPEIWGSVLTVGEFVDFWQKRGLNVLQDGHKFIDPTREAESGALQMHGKIVHQGEIALRALIAERLREKEAELSSLRNEYLIWLRAYSESSELFMVQAEFEDAMNANDLHLAASLQRQLAALKEEFIRYVPHFVFPMIVEEKCLSRRANWEAQFDQWDRLLDNWLSQEEAASSVESVCGGITCQDFVRLQIMHALKYTLRKPENLIQGKTKSVLHYVVSSRSVRGTQVNWRPDPLGAMYCWVRVWPCDAEGQPIFDPNRAVWKPCMLKLTGNAIKILQPNTGTLATTANGGAGETGGEDRVRVAPWKEQDGWYIPLQCFERLDCSYESVESSAANVPSTMVGKLVFRRNLQIPVDDDFVTVIRTDQFENSMHSDARRPEADSPKIMIGQTLTFNEGRSLNAEEVNMLGDRVNAYPLTFRLFAQDLARWRSVVWACGMSRPPRFLGDFVGTRRRGPLAPEPEPPALLPAPILPPLSEGSTSSSASSSSTSSSSDDPSLSSATPDVSEDTARKDDDLSSEEPSLTSEEVVAIPKPPPPPKLALIDPNDYLAEFKDWRFDAPAQADPSSPYKGEWHQANRFTPETTLNYQDKAGDNWRYQGPIFDNRFRGSGKLELMDGPTLRKLKAGAGAGPGAGNTTPAAAPLVAFAGTFLPSDNFAKNVGGSASGASGGVDRQASLPFEEHPGLAKTAALRALHPEGDTAILDDRDAVSADGGGPHLQGVPLALLDAQMNAARGADLLDNPDDGVLGAGAKQGSPFPGEGQKMSDFHMDLQLPDGVCGKEQFLPADAQWALRKLDPTLGLKQNLALGHGEAAYGDGTRFHKMNDLPLHGADNLPQGRGYFYCPACPLKLDGHFVDGRPHGPVVLDFLADDKTIKYCGEMLNGLRHGKGLMRCWDDKVEIGGYFFQDELGALSADESASPSASASAVPSSPTSSVMTPHNLSEAIRQDGEGATREMRICKLVINDAALQKEFGFVSYIGQMKRGLPEGKGKLVFLANQGKSTVTYVGRFKGGKRHGQGVMSDEKGNLVLSGMWVNDLPEGRVSMYRLSDGKVYAGSLVRGELQGLGQLYQGDSQQWIYQGSWHNNVPNGRGVLNTADGIYEGEFARGRRDGKGVMTFNDGRKYDGDWREDRPHGTGTYLDEHGATFTYLFDQGKITASSRKAYAGACGGGAPTAKDPTILECPISQHNPRLWGRTCFVKIDKLGDLTGLGRGIWQHHLTHPAKYHDHFSLAPFPPPPVWNALSPIAFDNRADDDDLDSRVILVHIKRAENLPNISAVPTKKMDPYCQVLLGYHQKSTKPHDKGHTSPVWEITFKFRYTRERNLIFTIYDRSTLGKDKQVASAAFNLADWLSTNRTAEQFHINLIAENRKNGETVAAGTIIFDLEVRTLKDGETISQDEYTSRKLHNPAPAIQDLQFDKPENRPIQGTQFA